MQALQQQNFAVQAIDSVIQTMFAPLEQASRRAATAPATRPGQERWQRAGRHARHGPPSAAPVKRTTPRPRITPARPAPAPRAGLRLRATGAAPAATRRKSATCSRPAGGYIPAGPSGSPTRGMAHILPTGRNFYSVDPRSVPSQSAWRVGQQLAREVLARHHRESGDYPESVAISIWGTSAMRTHGDDVARSCR
jgi:cobaltochelatase CobN